MKLYVLKTGTCGGSRTHELVSWNPTWTLWEKNNLNFIYILESARPTDGIYFTCDLGYYFLYDFVCLGLHSLYLLECSRFVFLMLFICFV